MGEPYESNIFPMASPSVPKAAEMKPEDKSLLKAFEVMEIIGRYRTAVPATARDRTGEGNFIFLNTIFIQIKARQPIQMILPAFPFKSPNRANKTLGSLPDKGEEICLAHLNGLCAAISDIYEHGAKLTIASDGLVYNDLLGVSDRDVWEYSHALREMVAENKYDHIEFIRLRNLLHCYDEIKLDGETYEKFAPLFRHELIGKYTPVGFDADVMIKSNEDICTTYRGYIKFLTKDLEHLYVDDGSTSRKSHKKYLGSVAKAMIERGAAFAEAIQKNYPRYIRLSIHPSNGLMKISINVLPRTSAPVTPWHSAPCYTVDGQFMYGWREVFDADPEFELVYKDGRPWCYRSTSELYNWSSPVAVDPIYPCGVMVTPVNPTSISQIDLKKVQGLAHENSPVVLRGFSDTLDHELIVRKAEDMDASQLLISGSESENEVQGSDPQKLDSGISSEWLPYDGPTEVMKYQYADNIKQFPVSSSSKYRLITATGPVSDNDRCSLFSASSLLFDHLPASYTIEMLQQLCWNVLGSSNGTETMAQPLVVPHFSHGRPCFRYHPLLSHSNITLDPDVYAIEDISLSDSARLCNVLNPLLYDRRVCYWHTWKQGDVLFYDTFMTTHTWESSAGEPGPFKLYAQYPC